MADTSPKFKDILPTDLYRLTCSALYSIRYQYPGNDLVQLSRLLKRWFISADNSRISVSGNVFGVSVSVKGVNLCFMTTPLAGNPILYDVDINDINDFFNQSIKEI